MFSIIVPIYKVEKYIEKCIRSILGQSYQDFEIILVDDGSPDSSAVIAEELLKKSGKKEYKIIHTENRGVSAARNTGVLNAVGEYIVMVDADDVLTEDFLYDFKKLTEAYPDSDIISCGFEIIYEDGARAPCSQREEVIVNDHFAAQKNFFERTIKFLLPALALKKDFIVRNNIRFDESVRYSEDVQFIWRCLAYNQNDVVHLTKDNYKYILHSGSTMTSSGIPKVLTFCGGMERMYEEVYEMLDSDVKKGIMQRMYFSMLHGAAKMMSYRDFKDLYTQSQSKKYIKEQLRSGRLKVRTVCVTILIWLRVGYMIMRKL